MLMRTENKTLQLEQKNNQNIANAGVFSSRFIAPIISNNCHKSGKGCKVYFLSFPVSMHLASRTIKAERFASPNEKWCSNNWVFAVSGDRNLEKYIGWLSKYVVQLIWFYEIHAPSTSPSLFNLWSSKPRVWKKEKKSFPSSSDIFNLTLSQG